MTDKKEKKIVCFVIVFLILLSIITIGIKKYNKYYTNLSINEIKNNTVEISKKYVDEDNNGKLVLLYGKINEHNDSLYDSEFDININATRLYRKVEIYQWVEEREETKDGKIKIHYKKEWSEKIIKSKKLKETKLINPTNILYRSKSINHDSVTIGAFELSKKQIENIICNNRLKLGNNLNVPESFIIYDNYFTNSVDPENPKVGDYRISYYYNDWEYATILAKQVNNTFKNYVTNKKEKINFIGEGKPSLDEIINVLPLIK